MVVQWLRFCAPSAGGMGSAKKKKKKEEEKKSFVRRVSVAAGMVEKNK